MPVGKIRLFGDDLKEKCDGGFKLVLINVVLGFVEEVIQGIDELLPFRLWRLGGSGLRKCKEVVARMECNMLRPYKDKGCKHSTKRKGCAIMKQIKKIRERHGSAGVLFPFRIVAEPPLGLDAPLGGRFACPFARRP